jgi:hypothetical protein
MDYSIQKSILINISNLFSSNLIKNEKILHFAILLSKDNQYNCIERFLKEIFGEDLIKSSFIPCVKSYIN